MLPWWWGQLAYSDIFACRDGDLHFSHDPQMSRAEPFSLSRSSGKEILGDPEKASPQADSEGT